MSHKVEGIAGYQRKSRLRSGIEDADLRRGNDFRGLNPIGPGPKLRGHINQIAALDIAKSPEERIAMAGENYISFLAREGRAGQMPYTLA